MAIPDYQTCMLHLLRLASDGAEHTLKNAVPALADIFQLTDAERIELLPSGQQPVFHNRVAWANTYLKKAELLRAPRRGVFTITDRGKSVLAKNPSKIDLKLLEQFPEFLAFKAKSRTVAEVDNPQPTTPPAIETPLESLEASVNKVRIRRKYRCDLQIIDLTDYNPCEIRLDNFRVSWPTRDLQAARMHLVKGLASLFRECFYLAASVLDEADHQVAFSSTAHHAGAARGEVCDPMSCLSMSTDQVPKSAQTKSPSKRLAAELFHVVTPT
jgi:hypothetical protein